MASASLTPQSFRASLRPITASFLALSGTILAPARCHHLLPRKKQHHGTHWRHCLASASFYINQPAPRFGVSQSPPRFQPTSAPPTDPKARIGANSPDASWHGARISRFSTSSSANSAPASEDPAESAAASESESPTRPNLLQVLRVRGFVESVTSEKLKQAAESPLKVYCGFDPTAESLHLGNLLGIIALAWAVRCGHTAVALLGGATARVGDPSGKSAERPVLDEETIRKNTAGVNDILESILRRQESLASSGGTFLILNNYDWWQGVSLLDFLRSVGKFARVGTMMAKESVKKRLQSEDGMSYTEFTYQLLQGYDFVHLYREHQVTVQMGGSDQWGNITAGTDLIRRLEALPLSPSHPQPQGLSQESGASSNGSTSGGAAAGSSEADGGPGARGSGRPPVFGLTWPLLLKSDGSKFGKSESGAIWLAPSYLSPYKFYQYMFNTPDCDVVRFLRLLTFLDMAEVAAIEAALGREDYVPNTAQRRLAEEVTRFVHGEEGLQEALRATQALAPGAATALDVGTLEAIAEDAPSTSLPLDAVLGKAVVDLAATSGLVASKGAGKRLVKQGGLYLNNQKLEGEDRAVSEEDLVAGRMLLLAAGKKNKMIVRIVSNV